MVDIAGLKSEIAWLKTGFRAAAIIGMIIAAGLFGSGWYAYWDTSKDVRGIAVQQSALSGRIDTLDVKLSSKLDLLGQRLDANAQRGEKSELYK